MPYDDDLIRPSVEMNLPLKSRSGDFNAIPDIAILLARQSGLRLNSEIVFLGECAFSQNEEILLKKLQLEVDAHPEITVVVMIIITEASAYHSPKNNSLAYQTFRRHPECSTLQEFLGMMEATDNDSEWLGPVTVAGHAWCRISNIDYYVWVKDSGEEKITIDLEGNGTMAHGVSGAICM